MSYEGGEGPGKGKHIVLIAAEQEYRGEQFIPMLADILSKHHGFIGKLPYEIDGKKIGIGDIVGGTFLSHHGNWSADSTRGDIIPEAKDHPILTGAKDIWGLTDVYRTYKEGESLPDGCTALVMGQPLIGRVQGGAYNPEKEPLPVVWTRDWTTSRSQAGSTTRNWV